MKTFSKKAFIYIFVGFLTFSSTSICYYRSVHAMEWVAGALAFEEALKWLMAAVGVVSVGGATADYWENHSQDFLDYCESQNITNSEVAEWQLKLCQGVLDKASSCWVAFKSWVSDLVSDSSGSGSGSAPDLDGSSTTLNTNDLLSYINVVYGTNFVRTNLDNTAYDTAYSCCLALDTNNVYYLWLFCSDKNGTYQIKDNSSFTFEMTYTVSDSSLKGLYGTNGNLGILNSMSNRRIYGVASNSIFLWNFNTNSYTGSNTHPLINSGGSENVDDIDSVNNDIADTDIISSVIPDTDEPEVSIPMPGLGSSDDTISSDTYDDYMDQIRDDDRPIDEVIEDIQDMLRIIAYDTDTDDVIPNKPDPNDPTKNVKKDEVINENRENMGFTLFGLENVFPFCIPWDIYAFISILEAEPVAPKFTFPFYNPTTKQYMDYEIDLSPWNDVAAVIRYGADFTFIVGLALATRRLIGAGGGD